MRAVSLALSILQGLRDGIAEASDGLFAEASLLSVTCGCCIYGDEEERHERLARGLRFTNCAANSQPSRCSHQLHVLCDMLNVWNLPGTELST